MGKAIPPTIKQALFRIRNDDGGEAGATWLYALNTGGNIDVDVIKRVRFQIAVDNQGTVTETAAFTLKFQYRLDGGEGFGVWIDIGAGTPIQFTASADTTWVINDGDATTEQLAATAPQWTAGEMDENNVLGAVTLGNDGSAGAEPYQTEFELVFIIDSAQVDNADDIEVRMLQADNTLLNAYDNTPSINVVEAAVFPQAVAGEITFIGNLKAKAQKALAGASTFIGTLAKKTIPDDITGAITFTGAVTGMKIAFQSIAGAITFVGTFLAKALKALAGASTFVGTLARKTIPDDITGAITFNGALTAIKMTFKSIAGAITFAGTAIGKALKVLAGASTFVGTLTKTTILKAITGAITFTGTVLARAGKALAGAITFTGTLARETLKPLAGAITFVGTVAKQGVKSFAGAITFVGVLATLFIPGGGILFFQADAGAMSFGGAIATVYTAAPAVAAGMHNLSGRPNPRLLRTIARDLFDDIREEEVVEVMGILEILDLMDM